VSQLAPHLVSPTPAVHRSFLEAVDEYITEARVRGRVLEQWPYAELDVTTLVNEEGFAEFVDQMRAQEFATEPRGLRPAKHLWYVDGDNYFGRLTIRLAPELDGDVMRENGHIGYEVRPSARRRGCATAMLREGLQIARGLGIDVVRICCDEGSPSQRVIEANGGVVVDRAGQHLGFSVELTGL
jgi:predicted acetyltransferase